MHQKVIVGLKTQPTGSGDNDSIEIGVNKANIIIRYDVKIDGEGHIIEDESKNMYITNTADFGDTTKGVKVTDQFVSGHSIESIKTADNYTLTTTQISALRSAIATWLSDSQYDSVQAVLNSGDETVIGNLIAEFQKAEWQQSNV